MCQNFVCYNHYLAKEYHKENVLNNVYCFVVVFFPSIQAVAESCYYGTEIPLASVLEVKIIHIKIV